MKFRFKDDGRSMDQVTRDIKQAMDAVQNPQYEPGPGATVPEDLMYHDLPYYESAGDRQAFMAGYNHGEDDASTDPPIPMQYGSPAAVVPDTSLGDYATGYQLGYKGMSLPLLPPGM